MIRTVIVLVAVIAAVAAVNLRVAANTKNTIINANKPFAVMNKNASADPRDVMLDVPPRYMWGWGPGLHGYCGSTSFQMHGIYYGNWISSQQVREASGGTELLVAVNAESAADNVRFASDRWLWDKHNTPQATEFVNDFIRDSIDKGFVPVIGVYEVLPSSNGDNDYDHIVPVVGYKKRQSAPLDGKHKNGGDDVEGIYFLDLYTNGTRFLSMDSDVKKRKDCVRSDMPQQPYDYCLPAQYNYGISLQGNMDPDRITERFQLFMPTWTEPDWGNEDGIHATPVVFVISAKAYNLTPGEKYRVYRYDHVSNVPANAKSISDFANSAYTNKFDFTAQDTTHTLSQFDNFMSSSTIFYRCVRMD